MERTFKDDSSGVKINIQLPDRVGKNQEVKLAKHKNSFPEKFGFLEIEPLFTEPSKYSFVLIFALNVIRLADPHSRIIQQFSVVAG